MQPRRPTQVGCAQVQEMLSNMTERILPVPSATNTAVCASVTSHTLTDLHDFDVDSDFNDEAKMEVFPSAAEQLLQPEQSMAADIKRRSAATAHQDESNLHAGPPERSPGERESSASVDSTIAVFSSCQPLVAPPFQLLSSTKFTKAYARVPSAATVQAHAHASQAPASIGVAAKQHLPLDAARECDGGGAHSGGQNAGPHARVAAALASQWEAGDALAEPVSPSIKAVYQVPVATGTAVHEYDSDDSSPAAAPAADTTAPAYRGQLDDDGDFVLEDDSGNGELQKRPVAGFGTIPRWLTKLVRLG